MADNIRLYITLSPYDFNKLREWATIRGKPPATYAGQIISARIESNLEVIEKQKADLCRYEGISVEEFESRLLGSSGESAAE